MYLIALFIDINILILSWSIYKAWSDHQFILSSPRGWKSRRTNNMDTNKPFSINAWITYFLPCCLQTSSSKIQSRTKGLKGMQSIVKQIRNTQKCRAEAQRVRIVRTDGKKLAKQYWQPYQYRAYSRSSFTKQIWNFWRKLTSRIFRKF